LTIAAGPYPINDFGGGWKTDRVRPVYSIVGDRILRWSNRMHGIACSRIGVGAL